MNIVLDTNALVSGLLTPFGPSGEIIRMIFGGKLVLLYDARILLEYEEVLNRPKFKFNKEHINTLFDFIKQNGKLVSPFPLKSPLPDPDDEPFLEVSIAGKAKCLVPGNIVHYPAGSRQGTKTFSPSKFLGYYRKQNEDTEPAS
jgi:putative PIN family toxin of toxin-antitoxin system